MKKLFFALVLFCSSAFAQTALPAIGSTWNGGSAPSFPTQGILDTFTRANENPLSDGGKWTCGLLGSGNLQILSNQVANVSGDGQCYWNNSTFGAETEVFVTVNTLPASGDCVGLFFRLNIGSSNGYEAVQCPVGVGGGWTILRDDSGTPTVIGTNSGVISAGDSIGVLMKGSTITMEKKTGGTWSSVFNVTDATYSAAGNIGLEIDDSTTRGTNFGGGTGTE